MQTNAAMQQLKQFTDQYDQLLDDMSCSISQQEGELTDLRDQIAELETAKESTQIATIKAAVDGVLAAFQDYWRVHGYPDSTETLSLAWGGVEHVLSQLDADSEPDYQAYVESIYE